MIIYLDVYFLKNVFFNFLLLYITSFFIRKKTKWYQLLLASLIGGMYAISALYSKNIFQSSILKIIIGSIMLVVTFGRKQVMQMMSSFFVLAYFVAGFIASLLNINEQIILLFFSISMLCIFLIYQKENKKSLYYNVEIRILAKTLELKAKLDTGNELKDSLFGDAVIVVSEECVKEELGEEIICILKNEKIDIPQQYQSRIKLITFQTIAEEGIKIGIKLDQIIIRTENQILESRAILILTDRKLKSCDALIGVNLLEGAYQYQIS